jgi:hypothetical protein
VFLFTVLINLGFAGFVLYMDYPLWTLVVAAVATVVVGVTIRHIHTGAGIAIPGMRLPGSRVLAFCGRLLWNGLQATVAERQQALGDALQDGTEYNAMDGAAPSRDLAGRTGAPRNPTGRRAAGRRGASASRGKPARTRRKTGPARPGAGPKAAKPSSTRPGGGRRRGRKGAK